VFVPTSIRDVDEDEEGLDALSWRPAVRLSGFKCAAEALTLSFDYRGKLEPSDALLDVTITRDDAITCSTPRSTTA
jgi:hypothetical protein